MKNWSSVFLGVCVLGAALIISLKSPEPAFSQAQPGPPDAKAGVPAFVGVEKQQQFDAKEEAERFKQGVVELVKKLHNIHVDDMVQRDELAKKQLAELQGRLHKLEAVLDKLVDNAGRPVPTVPAATPTVQQPPMPAIPGRYQMATIPSASMVIVCDTTTGQTWWTQLGQSGWSDMGTPVAAPQKK
jgi:hypothetical protein